MNSDSLPTGVARILAACAMVAACGDSGSPTTVGEPTATPTPAPTQVSQPTPPPETPLPASFSFDGEPCTPREGSEARTLFVTLDCVDPEFEQAFIDMDEERTVTHPSTGAELSYRYVRGGFTDTNGRFAFYFPAPEEYRGRFFESTYPTVPVEGASPREIAFGISNGAYVVSSNNGGGVASAPATGGYRVNAASAKLSRVVAAHLYGPDAPVRGYIYGASGGAYQSMGAVESTEGVWDGAVPIVPGVPNAIPSFQGVQVLALRVLRDRMPEIVDAVEPGGSGDPYATLNDEEAAILEEATRMGHPLRGWWQWETLRGGAFEIVVPAVTGIDSAYVDDFWGLPGYAGFAQPELRLQVDATISEVGEGGAIALDDVPDGYLGVVDLAVTSGAAAGSSFPGVYLAQGEVGLPGGPALASLSPGDEVRVDNSLWVALEYYQRHQVPSPDQYGWNQYRDDSGEPIHPQRSSLVGHVISQVFGGVATGRFQGKMIMLASVLDVQAYAWSADWYRAQAQAASADPLDGRFRLWFMDNADHQPPATTAGYAHVVLYDSEVEQALLDLDAWVADGIPPPASSAYEITEDNQVELVADAVLRGGVQPVVTLGVGASGCEEATGQRAHVAVGEPVALAMSAAVPPGAGRIVGIEWDFASTGEFVDASEPFDLAEEVELCATHQYEEAGTYFAVARVTAHRHGDPDASYRRIQNLARVRIVVD